MTVDNHIKTVNPKCNGKSGILVVFVVLYAAFESRVEKSNDKVRILFLFNCLYPFAGS